MKRENTNGLAGGEKGWQACLGVESIGVIFGYDQSTYNWIATDRKEVVDSVGNLCGAWMWDEEMEAIGFVVAAWEAARKHDPRLLEAARIDTRIDRIKRGEPADSVDWIKWAWKQDGGRLPEDPPEPPSGRTGKGGVQYLLPLEDVA